MTTHHPRIDRREALRELGALAVGSAIAPSLAAPAELPAAGPQSEEKPFTHVPVTCVILGAGSRGNTYAAWSQQYPREMKVVGVAEPIQSRQDRFARAYGIPGERRYPSYENALAVPKFADAILITMPDQLHHPAAMRGLELGYDVLLEKPIATTWDHCVEIREQNRRCRRVVAVCHVLRYTRYFRKLKSIIDSGLLGEVVTMEHLEPVGYWHMGHSFVRGNWRNVATSCPMILAKSCHDLDVLRWLAGRPCRSVASYGTLSHFRPEHAPAGSTARCTDGCAVEKECPYSAMKLYLDMKSTGWPVDVITEDLSREGRMKAMREGPYGRCVYRCDNDVVDHQVVAMEFSGGLTASFTMSAFTTGSRRTRVMGTMGEMTGDTRIITVEDFRGGQKQVIDTELAETGIVSGHGGGDYGLMAAFIKAVQHRDDSLIASSLDASVESHLMAFEAERSRLEGHTVTLG